MRIVFLGTPATAVASLAALVEAGHEIVGIVSQPDRPVGRSRTPQPPPVKAWAVESGLPVEQPERVRTRAFREGIAALKPDLLAVVAYGRILGPRLLATPRHGAVNVHFSLLPRYRGAAPVQWAIARGERESGVTTMRMNARLDEGDILLQRSTPIGEDEHASQLQARLAELGAELLVETVAALAAGTIEATPQRHDRATYAPPLSREDGRVELSESAAAIAAKIRGFDPWPGVWVGLGGKRLRLRRARAVAGGGEVPGTIVAIDDAAVSVACGEGVLEIAELQPEGRRAMSARDAKNGRLLAPGERLVGLGP